MAVDEKSDQTGNPEWTSLEKKRGLDPLGMQTTSVALYQQLVPGISNVTLRVRYYGLYAFLADWYARNVGLTSVDDWCRYVRRTEALYALVAQHAGNEHGIAGSRWAKRALAVPGEIIEFSSATDRADGLPQYLKQKFGAYGAAYGSQLLEVGMLEILKNAEHELPVPTEHLGDAVAKAFASEVGTAATLFLEAVNSGRVSRTILAQLHAMLPSRIGLNSAERQLYEDMMFGRSQFPDDGAQDRTRTLRLVLRIGAEYETKLNPDLVRWTLYARCRHDGTALQPVASQDDEQAFRWQVYQANDLLHACYEAVLRYTLDVLESQPSGLTLPTLLSTVSERVTRDLNWTPANWQQVLDEVTPAENAIHETPGTDYSLAAEVLTANRPHAKCPPEKVRTALTLLAILHRRFRDEMPRIRQQLPVLHQSFYTRSLVTEIEFLEQHAREPFTEFLQRLLRTRVLERHLWVAMQKLRSQGDYTFLIEADEGRVRHKQTDGPVLTNPRLGPAITFLSDLHLLDQHGPTPSGRRLMEEA
jgi:hypothetical protein